MWQIYFYTHDQGTSRGIHEYELAEPVRLEPGHYMVGVSFAGWGIATDLTQPNQMYSIFADSLGVFAVDWASYELGTAAIRTHVSVAPPLGIDETVSGAADNVTIIVSGNSLVVDGGSSEVNSLSIYSLSGVVLDEVKGMGNVCRYDLSAMTCGVYIVKAVTANGISTRKFAVR